jgi:hypothetical protein
MHSRVTAAKLCVVAVLSCATIASAQDPLKTLPGNYELLFENEWVKVTRVHYGPREKLPPHQHTETASAYVYLNDSGPVVFKHIDLPYGAVTRPATKAGSFRLYRGLKEIHEVENLSDLPSDFLRVEFKTEPLNDKTLLGRFFREDYPAGENFEKVQFQNEQVRISRLVCAPGKGLDINTGSAQPALLIVLSRSKFTSFEAKSKPAKLDLELGQTYWVSAGREKRFQNTGAAPGEMLRFDFKSQPLSNGRLKNNHKHEHEHK